MKNSSSLARPSSRFLTLWRSASLLLGALCVAIALCVPSAAFAQEKATKIGFVDLQQALNKVDDGKAAKKKLKADFEKKQKQLNDKQEELKKLKADIEGQLMLAEDAKRQKVAEFQKRMMELQQTYMALQGELAQAEAQATKKIFDRMGKIIEQMAKEKDYDIVLERTESALLFARSDMDMTEELIKRYNEKY